MTETCGFCKHTLLAGSTCPHCADAKRTVKEAFVKVNKKISDEGKVDTLVNHRCAEVDWFSEGILENYEAMILKELKL